MMTARRAGATSAATLFGLALAVVLVYAVAPEWAAATGLDIWDVPALRRQIEAKAEQSRELSDEIEEARNRLAVKEHLIENLFAGQMTLKEVTAQFLALNRTQPDCMLVIRHSYDGATDEEKTARNVLAYASERSNGSLAEYVWTMAWLVSQFHEIFAWPSAETH